MSINVFLRLTFIFILLVTGFAFANEEELSQVQPKQLGKIVAQSLMSDLPIEAQSKSVSVIDAKSLKSLPSSGGIQAALESVPSIVYSRSGGVGGQLSVRGFNSNHSRSVMTIDGVRFVGRNTLEFNLIDPSAVEEVEVIRGAASSLYGSDAMNGIINIKTRRFKGDISAPFSLSAKIKELSLASVNRKVGGRAELYGGGDGFDILVGLSGALAQDYFTPKGRAKNSGYRSFGLDSNVGYTNSANTRYYLQARLTDVTSKRAGGVGGAPGSSYGRTVKEDPIVEVYLRAGVESKEVGVFEKIDGYIYYRHFDTDIWTNNPNPSKPIYINQKVYNNSIYGGKLNFDLYNEWDNISNNISFGLDNYTAVSSTQVTQLTSRDANSTFFNSKHTNRPTVASITGLYFKDDLGFSHDFYINAGLRADYIFHYIYKDKGDGESPDINYDKKRYFHTPAITGTLGLVSFISDYFSTYANISHNFRSPAVGQRLPTTPAGSQTLVISDPNLKPERSYTGELGLRWTDNDHFINLVGYFTRYVDLIKLKLPVGQPDNSYSNVGHAYIAGFEMEGKHYFDNERYILNYALSYTYGIDDIGKKSRIDYIAPLTANIALTYQISNIWIKWNQRGYLGKLEKHWINESSEIVTQSYTMSDVFVGVDLGEYFDYFKDSEIILGIENLFNTAAVNPTTAVDVKQARKLADGLPNMPNPWNANVTNPLLEPGRNFTLKYVARY